MSGFPLARATAVPALSDREHPTQPIVTVDGVERFQANAIVQWLLKRSDMNEIAMQGFSERDHRQFAQLIGYSVSGYNTLSYAVPVLKRCAQCNGHGVSQQHECPHGKRCPRKRIADRCARCLAAERARRGRR